MDAPARAGNVLIHAIVIKNTGNADYTNANPAYIVDSLAGVLDDGELIGEPTVDPNSGTIGLVEDQIQ